MSGALPVAIVLATGNAGKLREMREILAPYRVTVRALADFTQAAADETGLTFVENALLKARFASAAAGLPALADDSGLVVDALNGAPGVHSARYAGPGAADAVNNAKLLRELAGVADVARTARYRCAMVFVTTPDDPAPVVAQADWEGRIASAPRGQGGFGYDPLFLVDGGPRTAAELTDEDKNARSHRAQALRSVVAALTAAGP